MKKLSTKHKNNISKSLVGRVFSSGWKKKISEAKKTHGYACRGNQSVEYLTYHRMWGRCYNKNNPDYKNYGGRGIKVCKRWEKFENFLADMGKRPKGLTIERINNNKGYSKSNCRWATRAQQGRNTRRNVKYSSA